MSDPASAPQLPPSPPQSGSAGEVFGVFLLLGLSSFGGPSAHIGYFRDAFVTRRRWLSETDFAGLLALCQFLPGPTSSKLGFALGLGRAGWRGALAAFTGFTLPSALLLLGFAWLSQHATASGLLAGVTEGLKVAAVAIVAQAVLSMAQSLCRGWLLASIAVLAFAILAFWPSAWGMMAAMLLGGAIGLSQSPSARQSAPAPMSLPVSARQGQLAAAAFILLLVGLPWLAPLSQLWALSDAFYRSGALVFGGGHVMLPLLEAEVVNTGWISEARFLAGYGAAQAVPGPLFTFAADLGAVIAPMGSPLLGASIALIAIFLPGFLLLIAALPFWQGLQRSTTLRSGVAGANAAVTGILAATLYHPVASSALKAPADLLLAVLCFTALIVLKLPSWAVVLGAAAWGAAQALLS